MKKLCVILLSAMVVFGFTACNNSTSEPWTIGVRLAKVGDNTAFQGNNEAIKDSYTFSENTLTITINDDMELVPETSDADNGGVISGTTLKSEGAWVAFLFDAEADSDKVLFNNAALGADNEEASITQALDGSVRTDTEFVQWINLSDSDTYGGNGRTVTIYNGTNTATVTIKVVDNTTAE